MKDCFKNSFEIKVVGINVILQITVLREALPIKDFLIISKLLSWFLRREVTAFFEINEKSRVKTLPHVASRVIKGIRIIYENEIFYK
jgi:hypothetical protein